MRSRTARIVAVGMSTATTLAACSGGSSKEDFIAAADRVCREADERVAEIGPLQSEKEILDFVEQTEDISADLVADLRGLEPPEEDEAQIDEMIDGLVRATDLLAPLARATIDRDSDAMQGLRREVGQVTDDVNEIAESYGFEACGAKVLEPVR